MNNNELSKIIITFIDITKSKERENKLHNSKKQFEEIITKSPLPMVITDTNGDIEFYNDKFIKVFGYTLDDVSTAEDWWNTTYPDKEYRQLVQKSWGKAIREATETGTQIETQEWNFTSKDRFIRHVEFDMMPLDDISIIAMNDLTEKQRDKESLEKDLDENKNLLKELQHHTKNSFVMISSMMNLMSNESKSNESKKILTEAGSRIRAVSEMYDLLYTADSVTEVKLNNYLNRITSYLPGITENITLNIKFDTIFIPVKTAIPIGIIVTKLLRNSIKYAFPDNKNGSINLLLKATNAGATIDIHANGIVLPEKLDLSKIDSLGLKLVNAFVNQIDGTIEIENNNGTRCIIEFPIK